MAAPFKKSFICSCVRVRHPLDIASGSAWTPNMFGIKLSIIALLSICKDHVCRYGCKAHHHPSLKCPFPPLHSADTACRDHLGWSAWLDGLWTAWPLTEKTKTIDLLGPWAEAGDPLESSSAQVYRAMSCLPCSSSSSPWLIILTPLFQIRVVANHWSFKNLKPYFLGIVINWLKVCKVESTVLGQMSWGIVESHSLNR